MVVPDSRFTAQKALARQAMDIQRQYNENFAGLEKDVRATAYGTNGADVLGDINTSIATAGRDATQASDTLARQNRALGGDGVSTSSVRRLGLARVLAEVDAGNRAGDAAEARQRAAQQFGTQQWGADSQSAASSLAQIAQSEQDRYAQYQQAKAARRSAIVGTLSGLAGAAIGLA